MLSGPRIYAIEVRVAATESEETVTSWEVSYRKSEQLDDGLIVFGTLNLSSQEASLSVVVGGMLYAPADAKERLGDLDIERALTYSMSIETLYDFAAQAGRSALALGSMELEVPHVSPDATIIGMDESAAPAS